MQNDQVRIAAGDRAQAEALRLAKEHLKQMGRRYSPADIGGTAGEILAALRDHLIKQDKSDD